MSESSAPAPNVAYIPRRFVPGISHSPWFKSPKIPNISDSCEITPGSGILVPGVFHVAVKSIRKSLSEPSSKPSL